MTAATSTKTKSYFGRRFVTRLAESKKLLIVNSVFSLLGLPLICLIAVIMEYYEKHHTNVYDVFQPDVYMMIGMVALFASFAMGLVVALFHFRYLYQKQLVDMNYSLPLNSCERFFADYLSGLFVYLIPIFAATLLSYGVILIGEAAFGSNVITTLLGHLTTSGIIVVIGLIMLYTFSVLGIVFCGSTFEAIFSIAAINSMIPATIACLWIAMINSSAFGIDEGNIIKSLLFTSTSPVGAAIFFGDHISSGEFYVFGNMGVPMAATNYFRWMIAAIVVILAALFGAFLLYKKRRAEDVSKPYIFKSYYYAIITMAVFCIMSLFISDGDNIIAGIIICAVGWFVMEVITRRGFKKFWTAGIGFVCAVGFVFGVCALCKATDGFGASRKVPSAGSVSSVELNINNSLGFAPSIGDYVTKDPEVILWAIELQEEIIDRHYHSENYEYSHLDGAGRLKWFYTDCNFNLVYHLKSGSTMSRTYNITGSMLTDLMKTVYTSDDFADISSKNMYVVMANSFTDEVWYRSYEEAKKKAQKGIVGIEDKLMLQGEALNLKKDEMEKLCDAYKTDMLNMTIDDLSNAEVFCYVGDHWILDSFKETKSVLFALGYSPSEIDEHFINTTLANNGYDPSIRIYDKFKICSHLSYSMTHDKYFSWSAEPIEMDEEKTISQFGFSYYSDYYGYGYYTTPDGGSSYDEDYINGLNVDNKADVANLLNALTPILWNERPIAIVTINGSAYCLRDTAENMAILEKVVNG